MGYSTDLTNQQWWAIKRFFDVGKYGNRRKHTVRELLNAVLYLLKTGCQWRLLPNDFPPYSTVHTFYRRCRKNGIWEKIMVYIVKKKRKESGRKRQPSYGILDSQSVKTARKAEEVGYDGNKKIKGRKKHISTDTQSNLLHVKVHAANIHDTNIGGEIAKNTLEKYPKIKAFSADEGYRKTTENYIKNVLKKKIHISKKEMPWKILPKRWNVERTFAWLNNFRRLSKDYETTTDSQENMVMLSFSALALSGLKFS